MAAIYGNSHQSIMYGNTNPGKWDIEEKDEKTPGEIIGERSGSLKKTPNVGEAAYDLHARQPTW